MLKDLMDGVYQVIGYWYKKHIGKSYEIHRKISCKKCGFEEWAPVFVVDEIADMDDSLEDDEDNEELGMPILV